MLENGIKNILREYKVNKPKSRIANGEVGVCVTEAGEMESEEA